MDSLDDLIPVIEANPLIADKSSIYVAARNEVTRLLEKKFTSFELSDLAFSVPDLFDRHKEWTPPLIQTKDGNWIEPDWFAELDNKLTAAIKAAQELRVVGYY